MQSVSHRVLTELTFELLPFKAKIKGVIFDRLYHCYGYLIYHEYDIDMGHL